MSDYDEKLNAFLSKTGLSRKDYDSEFAVEAKKYEENGLEVPTLVIFRVIKGRYSTSMKSNAVWYKGYFIGLDKPVDWAKKTYEEDIEPVLETYKQTYGDDWIAEAQKAGVTNLKGEPIHSSATTNQKWMYGKVIPASEPKRKLYAILEDDAGNRNFTIIYTTNINGFLPVPGQMYKFRAAKHKDTEIWEINTTGVSKLQIDGGFVPYDQVQADLEEFLDPTIKDFEELYDIPNEQVNFDPSLPKKINFACNMVMIASYNVVSEEKSSVDFVELTDLIGDYDDNLPVTLDHGLVMNMAVESQGIAVFVPFFKKDKQSGGKVPGGQLIGFLLNEQISPIPTVEPNTTELKSEDFE